MSNAHIFFNRFNSDTAQWLADFCDDVAAKGPQTSVEWRRIANDLLIMKLMAGEEHAIHVARQFWQSSWAWAERQHAAYDEARCTQIVTGTTTSDTDSSGTAAKGEGTSAGTAPATSGQNPTTVVCGPGTGDVPAQPGCQGGAAGHGGTEGKTIGTGTQGSLFVVRAANLLANLPTWRERHRAEYKRMAKASKSLQRQAKAEELLLEDIDLVMKAGRAIEDLANKHRAEDTLRGVLRAAGIEARDLGLSDTAVEWFDAQLKAGNA